MTEYEEILNELSSTFERFDLSLEQEEKNPESFGSVYSVYSGHGLKYRVIWDGKDSCGYVQYYENGDWAYLEENAPESKESEFKNAILRMRINLAEHLALAKQNT